MIKIFKILFLSSKKSFFFISFIIFSSLFSFIFTGGLINSAQKYLEESAKDFLWADIVVSDRKEFFSDIEWYILNKYPSETSKKISFETSIFKDDIPELYTVNYIEKNYPFYWELKEKTVNSSWSLIVSKKIYDNFKNEDIEILGRNYKIKSYLEQSFLANFNPFWGNDIYMSYYELDKTLVDKITRVRYSMLIKTDYVDDLKKDKKLKDFKLNTEETSNSTLNETIERLNIFIQVFYQIIILLAFFIISVSLNSYFKKITGSLKTLNILWLSNIKIIVNLFFIYFFVSLISSALSFLLVYAIFELVFSRFYDLSLDLNLLYSCIFISFIIIFSWSFLNLINLKATSINSFVKKDFLKQYRKSIISYFVSLFLILLSISLISGVSIYYSLINSFSFILSICLLAFVLDKVLKFIFSLSKEKLKSSFYIFDSIRSTIKPWNISVIIILSSFISLSGFLVFSTFSNGFISFLEENSWWDVDTFVINLDKKDIDVISDYFDDSDYYEIIRSRILEINGVALGNYVKLNGFWSRFSREFNSTTKDLSDLIKKGKKLDSWKLWVDEDFASDLWVGIWDSVKFLIAWIEKELEITQIREAVRDGVSPYFYFNFYEKDFEGFSRNYFLAYDSKERSEDFSLLLSKRLWKQVSFIDVWAILEEVRKISLYILYFVYIILAYISFFSIVSFLVSISFLKSFKDKKVRIYNLFWGEKDKLELAIFYEYCYLIVISFLASLVFSFFVSIILFSTSEILKFEVSYFVKSGFYSLVFIVVYIFIIRVFYYLKRRDFKS